ncbi:hypothetical protein D3C85_1685500 [compost metagenome]
MAGPQGLSHVRQGLQPPADREPDHRREQQTADNVWPQCMTHDAADQICAHIIALADPDAHAVLRVVKEERAPVTLL